MCLGADGSKSGVGATTKHRDVHKGGGVQCDLSDSHTHRSSPQVCWNNVTMGSLALSLTLSVSSCCLVLGQSADLICCRCWSCRCCDRRRFWDCFLLLLLLWSSSSSSSSLWNPFRQSQQDRETKNKGLLLVSLTAEQSTGL